MELETYARVMVELAAAEGARAEVLRRHGLDEVTWEALDTRFQAQLSAAMGEEGDGVPEVLSRYAAAYELAQRDLGAPIPIEVFARVTHLLESTSDLRAALLKGGVTLSEYVRATEHYSRRLATEPELAARFEAALRSP